MPVMENEKYEAVALAYLADPQKIGWRAWKKVYPKCSQHAAETAFSRLLKKAEFSARVAETHEAAAKEAVADSHRVLIEQTRLALTTVEHFIRIDDEGQAIIDLSKTTSQQLVGIGSIKSRERNVMRDGEVAEVIRDTELRLGAKAPALDMLSKHHALYKAQEDADLGGIAERLAEALARVDGKKHDKVGSVSHPPRAGHARKAARKGKRARA